MNYTPPPYIFGNRISQIDIFFGRCHSLPSEFFGTLTKKKKKDAVPAGAASFAMQL